MKWICFVHQLCCCGMDGGQHLGTLKPTGADARWKDTLLQESGYPPALLAEDVGNYLDVVLDEISASVASSALSSHPKQCRIA